MLILGLLSLVQVTFLPGVLAVRLLKLRLSPLQVVIYSFALSLTLNYLIVFALAMVGWYVRPVMLGIFCAELALLVAVSAAGISRFLQARTWAVIRDAAASLGEEFRSFVDAPFCGSGALARSGRAPVWTARTVRGARVLLLALSLLVLGWALSLFFGNLGTVFASNDSVVSWNRWALDWFHNRFPENTFAFYPQLITANWSVSYVFLGHPLEMFPKAIMPLFFCFLLLLLFDLGLRFRSAGYLLGMAFTAHMFRSSMLPMIGEGMADTAVSFMAFLAISCLLRGMRAETWEETRKHLLLGSVFACATVVTKHSGVYVLACFTILAAAPVLRFRAQLHRREIARLFLALALLVAVVDAPFFIVRGVEIARGIHPPISLKSYGEFNDSVLGATPLARLEKGSRTLPLVLAELRVRNRRILGRELVLGLAVVGAALVLFDATLGPVFVLLGAGWCLVWSLYLSYDLRNAVLAYPFLGLGFGAGLGNVPLLGRVRNSLLVAAAAATVLALGASVRSPELIARQTELKKRIGNAGLNALLYDYKDRHGIRGKIISNYHFLNYLPGFQDSQLKQYFERVLRPQAELEIFRGYLKRPEAGFVLVPEDTHRVIIDEIVSRISSGSLDLVFRSQGYIFAKIRRDASGELAEAPVREIDVLGQNLPLAGLGGLEGPYPQWDLPRVRWAVEPVIALPFAVARGTQPDPVQLSLGFSPRVRESAELRVRFNGQQVQTYTARGPTAWREEVLTLQPVPGRNRIELEFAGPTPPDGQYMLFRTLTLRGAVKLNKRMLGLRAWVKRRPRDRGGERTR